MKKKKKRNFENVDDLMILQGDGGGGIFCPRKKKYYGKTKWVLRAIISFGTVDCEENRPNVDVFVPEYREWILDNSWY